MQPLLATRETDSPAPTRSYSKLFVSALLALVIAIAILFAPALLRRLPIAATTLRALTTNALGPRINTRSFTTSSPASTDNPLLQSAMSCKSTEDRIWNSLADRMDLFHNHFRYEFDRVYKLCDGGFHKEGMTLPQFIREAQELYHHLHMHHTIEETYIFPILAEKMPQFKDGARESGAHLESHRQIHDGLVKYNTFLKTALANPNTYSATTLREIMDGFRQVLFCHLDEEVKDLGAESMKKAGWTLQELKRIPM